MVAVMGCSRDKREGRPVSKDVPLVDVSLNPWVITSIDSLAFSPNGKLLLVAGYDTVTFRDSSSPAGFAKVFSVPSMTEADSVTWRPETSARNGLFVSPGYTMAVQLDAEANDIVIFWLDERDSGGTPSPPVENGRISLGNWSVATLGPFGTGCCMVWGGEGVAIVDTEALSLKSLAGVKLNQ